MLRKRFAAYLNALTFWLSGKGFGQFNSDLIVADMEKLVGVKSVRDVHIWRQEDNPRELKTFFNLWLGQAWEERGDAPSWKRLLTLREDYPLGFIPQGALLITVGVDVQKDGFYFEVVGWGVGKTSWVNPRRVRCDYGAADYFTKSLDLFSGGNCKMASS